VFDFLALLCALLALDEETLPYLEEELLFFLSKGINSIFVVLAKFLILSKSSISSMVERSS